MPKYEIPAFLSCPGCGKTKILRSYSRLVLCDYCNGRIPFDGFIYRTPNMYSSELINTQAETDCPNCRSNNMFLGPEGRMWRCYDCGYRITVEDFENSILWFCDNCDAFLNAQEGFTDRTKTWKCKMCGFNNDVSENNVY